MGGRNRQDVGVEPPTLHAEIELEFDSPLTLAAPDVEIFLAFLDPQVFRSGVSTLDLLVEIRDEVVVDLHFDDVEAALEFFDDGVLALGGLQPQAPFAFVPTVLRIRIDLTSDRRRAGFATDFAVGVAVP